MTHLCRAQVGHFWRALKVGGDTQLRIPLPALPRETVVGMAELIKYDLLGEARGPAKWAAKLVEPRARAAAAGRLR